MPERGTSAPVATPEIDGRIAAQRTKLDELLRTYTDQHPDVLGTRRVIEQLEAQRKQEVEALQKASAAAGPGRAPDVATNPVFQQMRVSLSDAEANVASLRARLASLENQQRQLKSTARLVPQVEAEFAQLNRDYEVQKKTYGDLLARRESAAMGVDVQDTGGTQVRVIDPPRVEPKPVPPTRLMLLATAFLAALGIGVAASFVANELMPTFFDSRALRDRTKRPILGAVSMLPNPASIRARRRNAWLFAGGAGGLVATFVAVMTIAFLAVRTV
jgi:polysaccharide chain length determinant protein (PEP-CTERM system associated)